MLERLSNIKSIIIAAGGLLLTLTLSWSGPSKPPLAPFEAEVEKTPATALDRLVEQDLARSQIEPAQPCSDAVFLRRVYLDVIGRLPDAREAGQFLASQDSGKRSALIETLLAREEFADYWAMKWSDVLRINAEFPINLWPNAAQAYHRWVRAAIRDNMPYDQFVRMGLTSSGSNFRVPQVNFYRAMQNRSPQGIGQAVALSFMGVRTEKWPKERLEGMAAFFSKIGYKQTAEWKEEIVLFDPDATNGLAKGVLPDGTTREFGSDTDPRIIFADWLVRPENPWFARNVANRIWCWLLGRGIVHEPDDFCPENLPSNPELLALLERELVSHQFDLKHLYRVILNSRTYQRSAIPVGDPEKSAAHFGHYSMRRLDAEVLADVLNQITGTGEQYSSAIPEPFTYIPSDYHSVALPDGSINSSFLELFGRSSRDTGLESERNNNPTAAQSLHLLNSSHIQTKILDSPRLKMLLDSRAAQPQVLSGLYLMVLSRYPTNDELQTVQKYLGSDPEKKREGFQDLAWALLNSAEFQFRH